jgi:predicted 2-oxoglutarate/Fe(II)-dependent dioxygenase YbiX
VPLAPTGVRVFAPHEAATIAFTAAVTSGWSPATINADLEVRPPVRDAEVLEEATHRELFATVRDRLYVATRALAVAFAPATVLAEIQLVRYRPGGRYVDHRDALDDAGPRALSIVCYLNDDFDGGATAFADPDLRVEPATGTAIVFAPTLLHRAEPVTRGTKYAITAWYHALPAESAARR